MNKLGFTGFLAGILMIGMPLATASCAQESPNRIEVERESPPRFTFSNGDELNLLYIYHVPNNLLNEAIPGENLRPDNPNMVWWIEGKRRVNSPITYGVVPVDMREIAPSQPLVEGEHYIVYGHHTASGGTIGRNFLIRNGIPVSP